MIDALLKGFTIGLLLIISVGPVLFAVFKQSINNGHAGGFSFVGGVWLSDVFWVILSNVFSTIVVNLLRFEKQIGIIGSIFLMGLGIYYIFFKKIHLAEDENRIVITRGTHAKLAFSGFLINTLNPGVIFFWLTTATFFAARNTVYERIVIFSTCLLVNTGADILKVLLAGKIRKKINERVLILINRISGMILLGFAIVLFMGVLFGEKLKH